MQDYIFEVWYKGLDEDSKDPELGVNIGAGTTAKHTFSITIKGSFAESFAECESIARTQGLENNCELIGFSLVPDDATVDDEDEEA